ncbi:hypothetical protein KPH14_005348 [Odynerus spinipes]|uniref:Uncharacterized protein n=1 Tax=Odynerus spinipes TaxID=1348599 RepID=A0AAD9RBI9_9HYME|nr:hypothetical protein KPH14_005348 [Odynerus spinipes]
MECFNSQPAAGPHSENDKNKTCPKQSGSKVKSNRKRIDDFNFQYDVRGVWKIDDLINEETTVPRFPLLRRYLGNPVELEGKHRIRSEGVFFARAGNGCGLVSGTVAK